MALTKLIFVFTDRPSTAHKHSLQALSVYVHDDHTFKINSLICGPPSADYLWVSGC